MEWAKGYTAKYYMAIIDPATWREVDRVKLNGGTIKRDATGLRQSADMDCINWPDDQIEYWVRVYLDADQSGEYAHEPIFTGLATSPDDAYRGATAKNSIECYSVLKPAEDVFLDRGWFAPAGSNGGDLIQRLLEDTPAPVLIADNSPNLTGSIVAEESETKLTMIDKVLNAINWRLRITGDGVISIMPPATEEVASLDPLDNDIIEIDVSVAKDMFNCPNVFRAIDDDLTAVARDDSPESLLSTVNRGREVWAQETNCDLSDNETIAEYAQRKLAELQKVAKVADYKRRFDPNILVTDRLRLRYPAQGLDAVFYVESQSIELDQGARTTEKVMEVI